MKVGCTRKIPALKPSLIKGLKMFFTHLDKFTSHSVSDTFFFYCFL